MIKVLYVAGEQDNPDLVRSHLEDSGEFSVEIRSSAQEAIDALDSLRYDAVVSDYHMPGMDGIEFLRKLREYSRDIPFIMFSAPGKEQVVIDALNYGADYYVQKTGSEGAQFVELGNVIKRALTQKNTEKTLHEQEQRYHDLQNANDMIQSVDPEGRFLYVNKKWMETLGYEEEDIPDLGLFDIIHEDSLAHCLDTFHRVISGENVGIIDAAFKTRDGRKVYVEGMADCRFSGGKPQYTRGIFKDVTDRRMAESALIESEARYRVLIENVPDYILVHTGGVLRYISPGSAERLGYSRDEMIGQSLWQYILPEYRKMVADALEKRLTGEEIEPYDIEIFSKPGGRIAVEIRASQIIYDGLPSVLVVLTDITERKKMENAIRESEERFRSLVETTSDIVWEIDEKGRYVYVSPKVHDILGYEPGEIKGKTPFDLMPAAETEKIRVLFDELIDAKKPIVRLENTNMHKDGREVILETNGEPILTVDGVFKGYRGIDRDITDRKHAEEKILRNEQYLKTLLESIPAGVMVVDEGTHEILRVNNSAVALFGATAEEVVGKICHEFICPNSMGNCPITDKGQTIDRSERVLLNSTGETIPVFKSVVKMNLNGQNSLVETFVDISDRKRAEEALKKANRQLTLMTRITRHDILNNISVLLGYLALMRECKRSPETDLYLDKLELTTQSIQSQIEFTKIYQDLGTSKPQWQDMQKILSRMQVPASVSLSTDIQEMEIYADPLLERVFTNLLDNSIRHGKSVSTIRVACERKDDRMVIYWEDNGIGIPARNKARIFDQGYGKHTGLGLYLVREILGLTGIAISETGIPGRGALFEIAIPDDRFRLTQDPDYATGKIAEKK